MVKGCQRRIILLRGTGSGMFEEAYFILKPEKAHLPEQMMIAEANRIVEQNLLRGGRRERSTPQKPSGKLLAFLLGLMSGSACLGLLWLFLG
ncbi:MAG: hypothetical protein IJF49_01150 [Clostridia bacterium]|nr:hypothetical protein [Clostridia bacterium]